jgi:hypothetical protein
LAHDLAWLKRFFKLFEATGTAKRKAAKTALPSLSSLVVSWRRSKSNPTQQPTIKTQTNIVLHSKAGLVPRVGAADGRSLGNFPQPHEHASGILLRVLLPDYLI